MALSTCHAGQGLVAVLLITRSRPGPRLVFHYPESPNLSHAERAVAGEDDDSDSDSDDEKNPGPSGSGDSPVDIRHVDDEACSEQVLGHSVESLEKLLSPGRWCDGKRFEVCVDGLTFLGHPVYAPEDGNWSPELRKQQEAAKASKHRYGDYHMYLDPGSLAPTPPESLPRAGGFTHVPDSFDSQIGRAFGTSMDSTSTSSGREAEQMSMFHVVFALRSYKSGSQNGAKAVYRDVAKKLSKALHYCQKQSNYVGVESRKLLALRAKAKQQNLSRTTLWTQMVETSELTWALKQIHDRISQGEVAGIRLNGMEMSLFINPSPRYPQQKLEPLSALLLLEPKEALLSELTHPDAAPLAHFVREHTPTKNLQKHSNNLGIPINDILYLAQHLLKWRKARIITPLHQRNTYVVSPDAPLDKLPTLIETYSKTFPTLPSLPNMIKALSGKPIKYGLLVPSRDHRMTYMDILGFLVRHGLVVQLMTYGWLRVPRYFATESNDPAKRPLPVRSLLSPRLRPAADEDAVSVSSERTAIALSSVGRSTSSKRLSDGTQNPQQQSEEVAKKDVVTIADPVNPSEEEAKIIAAITASLANEEMRDNFPLLLPHLDGEHPFEQIAARQGMKTARVEEWLNELDSKGLLMTVRCI
ncbi:Nitrogen permease regulator 3 [Lecanosticta acicola]|uniref:Nitrogen permease regulator 3 n=1 Tax=Lecanosticta acicola TaxID=111012 RepID=A0AAI9ECH6_9PEZI|nr:Nitrogen permease regulator 3 [Lecanosticta acicola]